MADAKNPVSPAQELSELTIGSTRSRITEADLLYAPFEERFDLQRKIKVEDVDMKVYAGRAVLYADIRAGSPVIVAFGRADEHLVGARQYLGRVGQTPTFAPAADLQTAVDVLKSSVIQATIKDLGVSDDEQMVVAENRTIFVFRPLGAAADTQRLKVAIRLIRLLRQSGNGQDEQQVSQGLRPALGLSDHELSYYAQWSMTDDDQRAAALETASDRELVLLAKLLEDRGEELHRLLETLEQADPDAAASWGAVGEAAAEARLELTRRNI